MFVWDRLHGDKGHIRTGSVLNPGGLHRKHARRDCRVGPDPFSFGPAIRSMRPDRYPEILLFQPLLMRNSQSIKSLTTLISSIQIFPLGIFVAQYSVHAIAGLKPDYGNHFPNIRSPEGWRKDNIRSSGIVLQPKGQLFRKGCQIGFTGTGQ